MLFTWSSCCDLRVDFGSSWHQIYWTNCKILVFVICGALRNCTECVSLHLTFNMDQNLQFWRYNVRAKENKFVWLVMAIDSIVWSNFGSRVPSESWNWKHGKMAFLQAPQFWKKTTNKHSSKQINKHPFYVSQFSSFVDWQLFNVHVVASNISQVVINLFGFFVLFSFLGWYTPPKHEGWLKILLLILDL